MATKLIVLAGFVAIASANVLFGYNVEHGYAPRAAPVVPLIYFPYAAPQNDSKTDAAGQIHVDPVIAAVYDFHKTFLEKQQLRPPFHYSYGYEFYNWQTDLMASQYETRYGDRATGTYTLRARDGSSSIVDYTVDTHNGFHGIVRRDFLPQPTNFGYARNAGTLAYASHPAHEEYASRTTLLAGPEDIGKASPLAQAAYVNHNTFVNYFNLQAPFSYSVGYEAKDSHTRHTRSQYETYHGEIGEGSYTLVGDDGTRGRVDYSISANGFAVTSPHAFAVKANP